MEYFDYLPFCRIFSSADNLHAAIYPALGKPWQMFIPFKELKSALKDFADYYDAMTTDQKRHGSMTYADYPPVEMNNATTQPYDRFMPGCDRMQIFRGHLEIQSRTLALWSIYGP